MLSQNSPNSSRYFSKHKSVPLQILDHSSVLWHITPLYFFWLKHIFSTKAAHQSANFRHATARIKIHQIPHVIFGTKSLSSSFASLFSVMRHNSSVFFHLKLYMLYAKGAHQSAKFSNFRLLVWKLTKFLVILKAKSQFSFKFCITFQCHDT